MPVFLDGENTQKQDITKQLPRQLAENKNNQNPPLNNAEDILQLLKAVTGHHRHVLLTLT